MKPSEVPCELIQDLLPNYVEKLTSDKTNEIVTDHLNTCDLCSQKYKEMTSSITKESENQSQEATFEIDYLKKVRNRNDRRIRIVIISFIILLIAGLGIRDYFIGYPMDNYDLIQVLPDEDMVQISGIMSDVADAYKSYRIDRDGSLRIFAVKRSMFSSDRCFNLSIPFQEVPDDGMTVSGYTVLPDKTVISKMANALYENYNPYIGDMSANGRVVRALGLVEQLGNFKNELQTTTEPYGWKLIFETGVVNSEAMDAKMKTYACALMAMVDNLGEVTWEYTVELPEGTFERSQTITKEECSSYVNGDIKSFAESPKKVQELLDILKLN